MKTAIVIASLFSLTVSSTPVLAYGEIGQWSSGWGQGVSEYTTVDASRNSLYIACSSDHPVSMTLTVQGKEYGSSAKKGFALIIDGNEIQTPYDTASRVGQSNFFYAWDKMRSAKKLQAKTEDGRLIELPVKNAGKVLPPTRSKQFSCTTEF